MAIRIFKEIEITIVAALTLANVIIMLMPVIHLNSKKASDSGIAANANFEKKLPSSMMQAIMPTIINTIIQKVI